MKPRFCHWILPVLLLFAAPALADPPTISTDTILLNAHAPNQTIALFVSGNDVIAGEELYLQINDGTFGPTLSSVDILTGTIFDGNNHGDNGGHAPTGVFNSGPYANRLAVLSTTTFAGTVFDNGLLARVTVDTTNFDGGTFRLNVTGTANGDSFFVAYPSLAHISPIFVANQISIVPEPASLAFLATAPLLLCRRRRRPCPAIRS